MGAPSTEHRFAAEKILAVVTDNGEDGKTRAERNMHERDDHASLYQYFRGAHCSLSQWRQ